MKKLSVFFILSIGITIFGCQESKPKEKIIAETANLSPMQKKKIVVEEIMKLSILKANEEYGEPFETDKFNIKDGLPEFRIQLYNSYKKDEDLEIFEATWHKNDTTNITVWYKQIDSDWLPFDNFEWQKGLEF